MDGSLPVCGGVSAGGRPAWTICGAQALLLAAAGLLTAVLLAIPALRGGAVFSTWHAQSVTALHRLRYERSERILPEGDLAGFSADADEQTPCLTVTMEQPTTLYLRGFTAETFTGDTWQAAGKQTLAAQSDLLYWLHKDGFYPQTQLAAAARSLPQAYETQTVQIENTGACSAWEYVPYGLAAIPAGSTLAADSLEEASVPAQGLRGTRQYRFVMLADPEQTAAQTLTQLAEQPEAASHYPSQEGSYRSAVQARALALDDETRVQLAPLLDAACREYGAAKDLTPEQAQLCTLRFLDELETLRDGGTVLPLDKLAKDTTYQTATLTVLALRYYGILARYAEGFVLTQETAARTAPGGTVTLTAGNAQAWAEVYQDGIGWIPMELTPGLGEVPEQKPEETQNEGDSDSAESETQPEETTPGEDSSENPEPDGGTVTKLTKTVLLGALWVLLAVLLLLLLLIFRRKLLRKRRERKYQLENVNEAVSWIFADTAALLEKLGLRRGNGSMRALCEPAKQRFGDDYATALAEAIRLNDRAMFSSHALTQEQRESALKFYADTQGSLKKNVKWYHRVWIKWIQCLY